MGRELRRKQAKKEGKSLTKEQVKENNEIKKLIKITGLLVFIIALIYIISGTFITKELKWFKDVNNNSNTSQPTGPSNSIIAASTFKQSEEEYYVYFYDFTEENNTIGNFINSKLSDKKVYRVDTSSALNANYVSESSNKSAKNIDELKVVKQTLIKITGESISEYYEGEEITNNLK